MDIEQENNNTISINGQQQELTEFKESDVKYLLPLKTAVILSVLTFGLFVIVLFYRLWHLLKEKYNYNISNTWIILRTIGLCVPLLNYILFYELFYNLKSNIKRLNISPLLCTIAIFGSSLIGQILNNIILSSISNPFVIFTLCGIVSIFIVLPFLYIHNKINILYTLDTGITNIKRKMTNWEHSILWISIIIWFFAFIILIGADSVQ